MGTGWILHIKNAPHLASDTIGVELEKTPFTGNTLELNVQKKGGDWELSSFRVSGVSTEKHEATIEYLRTIKSDCGFKRDGV